MRLRAFLPIEDIAQPAKAPAAPAAELTSVDSPPPFGVLKPKLGVPSSPEVESGCDPSARPDQKSQMTANHLGSVLLEYLDEHCHGPKCLVPYSSTRDQNETTAKGSNVYLSLSTNAPATSPTTFPASSSTSNEFAHAIQAMRAATRAGGKSSFNALAQAAPRTLRRVLCPSVGPSLPMRMIELVRMGASGSD